MLEASTTRNQANPRDESSKHSGQRAEQKPVLDALAEANTSSLPDAVRWHRFFETLVANDRLHTQWLNTLAMMEHIGCRKMVKALDSNTIDLDMLAHIAEEARHAFFFKQLSLRLGAAPSSDFTEETMLAGSASRHYFQALDAEAAQVWQAQPKRAQVNADGAPEATSSHGVYLCVTTLVEERATALYTAYEHALRRAKHAFSLQSILVEESRHLAEMAEAMTRHPRLAACVDTLRPTERELFRSWSEAIFSSAHAFVEGTATLVDVHSVPSRKGHAPKADAQNAHARNTHA